MKRLAASTLLFVAIGLALYAAVYYGSERLVERTAHANPFHKIATRGDADWVILGASHAMVLDFADVNERMERDTGLAIVNLAATGTGPLYNRFVLEEYLRRHKARNVLYVADAFTFYSRAWNEDRFADAKLIRRTPYEPAVAWRMWRYAREEGIDPRAALDYMSGFSKVNNRERLKRDVWEGEEQFERVYRPSASVAAKRIAYLYPDGTPAAALDRYLGELADLVAVAQSAGARVVVIKMPLPAQFRAKLPDEDAFDARLAAMLAQRGVALRDFTSTIPDARLFFDSDHLNRTGVEAFFARDLKAVLEDGRKAG
jgi:hypothetical protein